MGNAAEQPEQGGGREQWEWRQRWQEPETLRVELATLEPLSQPARGPPSVTGASRSPPAPGGEELNPSHID